MAVAVLQKQMILLHVIEFPAASLRGQQHRQRAVLLVIDVPDGVHDNTEFDVHKDPVSVWSPASGICRVRKVCSNRDDKPLYPKANTNLFPALGEASTTDKPADGTASSPVMNKHHMKQTDRGRHAE